MSHRAVFFDRDDTLMVNVPYLGDPAAVEIFRRGGGRRSYELAQGRLSAFRRQQPVGRGARPHHARAGRLAVNVELKRQLGGDYIHAFYHSFATPDDPYADRPQALAGAAAPRRARSTTSTWPGSFFIGDRLSDIECGLNAGCRTVLLTHAKSSRKRKPDDEDASRPAKGAIISPNI